MYGKLTNEQEEELRNYLKNECKVEDSFATRIIKSDDAEFFYKMAIKHAPNDFASLFQLLTSE